MIGPSIRTGHMPKGIPMKTKMEIRRRYKSLYNVDLFPSKPKTARRGYYIYAVALKEHSGIVKVGMTTNWASRRISYDTWNLRNGDGIDQFKLFTICDEFVDLARLEKHILNNIEDELVSGREWFRADFDEICRIIDKVMCDSCITYI